MRGGHGVQARHEVEDAVGHFAPEQVADEEAGGGGDVCLDFEPKVRGSRVGVGDTIIGGNHQGAVVTLVERKSKHALMGKSEDKSSAAVHKVVVELLKNTTLPKETITFDNGTEFAYHQQIAEDLGVKVYFANPNHSWERGLNENTNGLIRQFIPKKQNLKELDQKVLEAVQENLNNRPRKSLGFLTPIEFYQATDKKTKICCI